MRLLLTLVLSLPIVFISTACERTARSGDPQPQVESQALPAAARLPEPQAVPDKAKAKADDKVATATAGDQAAGDCGGGDCGGGGSACGGSCGSGDECGGGGGECGCAAAMANRAPRNVPRDAVWTTMSVVGMRCGGCAKKIEAALASVDGVYDVTADHKTGTVRVAAASSDNQVRDRVAPQIRSLGYRVQ